MLRASCHCKATQIEAAHPPESVGDCNCSYCSKRGALWAYYDPEDLKLLTARDRVSTYQWGDYMMEQHFCGICGVPTFNEGPAWDPATGQPHATRRRVSVNARLFDGFDLATVPVEKLNGRDDC